MKHLHHIEVATWIVGLVLLGIYGGSRWWYAYSSDEAVASFEGARSAYEHRASISPPKALRAPEEPVDQSTWSRERIKRYRESLNMSATPEAVLRIPSLKLVVPIFEGATEQNLNRGAGRIESTPRIGEPGNVGIAAHRDGFFRALKDIRVDDVLLIDRVRSTEKYRVVATYVVDPSDVSVLAPTPARAVTLVTCYPFYFVGSAPRRFIVRAELIAGS